MRQPDEDLKPEYDFSHAERGKHYAGPDADFHVPVYLNQKLQTYLSAVAERKGVSLSDVVNDLLGKELTEAMR